MPMEYDDKTFLQETIEDLARAGKAPSDVQWVQANGMGFSWSEFERLAKFDYYRGYGTAEINQNLKVVGADWWLERHEYDGAEWWEFKQKPERPPFAAVSEDDLKKS